MGNYQQQRALAHLVNVVPDVVVVQLGGGRDGAGGGHWGGGLGEGVVGGDLAATRNTDQLAWSHTW